MRTSGWFVFFLILTIHLSAQVYTNLHFDTYSTEYVRVQKGLSQNSIMCMLEDSNGFLWIGTWDGLNRFDGYEFLVFKPGIEPNTSNISNSTINALIQDSEGLIWVGTDEGLNRFHPEKMEFSVFYQKMPDSLQFGENRIFSLAEGKNGEIWVGTLNGLYVFNKEKEEFRFIPFPSDRLMKNHLTVFKLFRSPSSDIMWVGTNQGLYRFDIESGQYINYSQDIPVLGRSELITAVFEDSNNMLWVGTEKGLYLKNLKNGRYEHFTYSSSVLKSNHILSFMEDQQGSVWIGTMGGGIVLYENDKMKLHVFGNPEQLYGGLSNDYIYSLLQTRNGSIWIGTWRGLNKFTPGQFRFFHISFGQNPFSLNSNMVWSFMEVDPNTIWVGTENGINVYYRNDGRIHYITKTSGHPLQLRSNKIRATLKDSRGRYWIGTFDEGVVCYDPANLNNVQYYPSNSENKYTLAGNSVWSITEDPTDKSIWLATSNGLSRINESGDARHYYHDPSDPNSISQNEVYWVICDSKNTIWITSFSGVDIYNRENDNFVRFETIVTEENRLKTNRILSAFEDSGGNIWFATMGEGVSRFNPVTGELITLSTNDGLANNTAYNFVEDYQGNIWITTNQGISKVNAESLNIWNFDVRDGVQGHEFNLGAAGKLSTGEIIMGGMNGFNIFNPEMLIENVYDPKIFITRFSVYNEKRYDFLKDKTSIHLSWWENYFSFEFAALDYANPKKINYAYQLEGFDNDWIYVSSDKRYADYTNIPPGKYVFSVRGTNSDGLWSENILSIYITVAAPFWKTLWFKITTALLLTFLIWLTVDSQIRKLRKKQEIEKKIFEFEKNVFELEQKVLHLQMNPHFLFNSLNSIQSFILKNESEAAVHYLSKFSNLMRLMLQTSRSSYVVVSDEIKLLQYYLEIESLRFENVFEYEISMDTEIDEEFTAIPAHMVQPLVENSVKHGLIHKSGEGHVEVIFKQKKDHVEITVEDNGVGRKRATEIQKNKKLEVSNQGIKITQERLEIFNKQKNVHIYGIEYVDLHNEEGVANGTKVILKVPFMDV